MIADVILSATALVAVGLTTFLALVIGFGLGWRARGRFAEAHRKSVQRLRAEEYEESGGTLKQYRPDWERENQDDDQ